MSQKAAEEQTQSKYYLAIGNEPKKHSSWTAECWEVVTQYLFSCMLLTLHIYSRYVFWLARLCIFTSTFSHASPPDYLLRARLHPDRYCARAERVAPETSRKYVQKKLARAGRNFFWNHFRLRLFFKTEVRMRNRKTTPLHTLIVV